MGNGIFLKNKDSIAIAYIASLGAFSKNSIIRMLTHLPVAQLGLASFTRRLLGVY